MGAMGGTFGAAIDEARSISESVVHLLSEQNSLLKQIVDKPTAKALTKFDVISEGKILIAPIPQQIFPEFTTLGTPRPGEYWRIDHWAYIETEIGGNGCQALAIGDGARVTAIVDLPDAFPMEQHAPELHVLPVGKSNPQNLIIPPNVPLLATTTPGDTNNASTIFVSYTAFALSL